jgi:hypothetical protein
MADSNLEVAEKTYLGSVKRYKPTGHPDIDYIQISDDARVGSAHATPQGGHREWPELQNNTFLLIKLKNPDALAQLGHLQYDAGRPYDGSQYVQFNHAEHFKAALQALDINETDRAIISTGMEHAEQKRQTYLTYLTPKIKADMLSRYPKSVPLPNDHVTHLRNGLQLNEGERKPEYIQRNVEHDVQLVAKGEYIVGPSTALTAAAVHYGVTSVATSHTI